MLGLNQSPAVGMQDFTFQVELLRTPQASRLGVDLIVAKTANDGNLLMVERVGKGGLVEEWNSRRDPPYQVQSGDIILSANGVQGDIKAMSTLLRTAQDIVHITVLRKSNSTPQVPPVPPAPAIAGVREAMLESAVGPIPRTAFEGDGLANLEQMNAYVAGLSAPVIPPTPQVTHIGPEGFTFEVVLRKAAGAFLGIDMLPAQKTPCLMVKQVLQGGVVAAWNHQCKGSAFAIHPGDYIIRVNDVMDDITAFMEEMRAQSELHLTILRRDGTGPPAPPAVPAVPDAKRLGMHPSLARPLGGGAPLPASLPRPPQPGFKAGMPGYEMDLRGAGWRDEASNDEFTFEVEIEKPRGHKLGIDVMLMTGGGRCGLLIGQVAVGGYAHLWNQRSQWPRQILKNDLIIAANGISAWTDLPRMAQEFDMDICRVRFTVQRSGREGRPAAPVQQAPPQLSQAEIDNWLQSRGQHPPAQSVPSVPNMAPGNWAKPLATSPMQDRGQVGPGVPPLPYGHRGVTQALPSEEEMFGMPPGLPRSMALNRQVDGYLEKQIPLPSMATNKMRSTHEPVDAPFPSGVHLAEVEDKQAVDAAHAAATAEAIAAAVVDDDEVKTSKLPPAKLLLCTLQLNDEDLTTVLQEALAQRPWLTAPVKQAIMEHSTPQ